MIQRSLGFLLGLSCLYWLKSEWQVYTILSLCLLFGLLVYFIVVPLNLTVIKSNCLKHQYLWLFIKWLFIGLLWASLNATLWLFQVPKLIDKPQVLTIQGYVCSIPHTSQVSKVELASVKSGFNAPVDRLSFDFCLYQLNQQTIALWRANKVKLTLYRPTADDLSKIKSGTHWQLVAKIKPIHGRLNPGGFDYEQWLVSNGFVATGYVKQRQALTDQGWVISNYHKLRQKVFDSIYRLAPNSEHRGLLLALAMGERKDISDGQWAALKDSGTAHLLAISGLHIGIAAIWSYYLLLWFFSRFTRLILIIPAQKLANVASVIAALAVALLSGMGYPAQRALLMLLIFSFVSMQKRHLSLANLLALSVIIIGFLQPMAILTVSFWMSVMAVAVIALVMMFNRSKIAKESEPKLTHRLFKWLGFNAYLFVCLMPITWLVFDGISLVGLLANLILIPLTSLITAPLVYLASLTLLLNDWLAAKLFLLADFLLAWTMWLQQQLAQINQIVQLPAINSNQFIFIVVAAFLVLLPKKMPAKRLILPSLVVFLLSFMPSNRPNQLKLLVFDIGQGLAVFVEVEGKKLLFDTGYGNRDFSLAKSTLLPYFDRNLIGTLDKLVISHKDSDHSGGLVVLLNNLNIEQLLIGETLKKNQLTKTKLAPKAVNCHQLPDWTWAKVQFSFINRQAKTYEKGNNQSCVLLIKTPNQRLLLTADIERAAESRLMTQDIQNIDLLVAPHHGSLTSSSQEFVSYTQPKVVVYPTGYANRWNFPKSEVTRRYSQIGATQLITHEDGAIEVTVDFEGKLTIISERQRRSHFWQRIPVH
ncbi:MAG: DNA internalization-related competence protein ComEC/Rec2 [Enterobacterales bacterium]|nr:DNA internalization-related competence protein ComEC/Rec2 [Enterobacterales bacterium]